MTRRCSDIDTFGGKEVELAQFCVRHQVQQHQVWESVPFFGIWVCTSTVLFSWCALFWFFHVLVYYCCRARHFVTTGLTAAAYSYVSVCENQQEEWSKLRLIVMIGRYLLLSQRYKVVSLLLYLHNSRCTASSAASQLPQATSVCQKDVAARLVQIMLRRLTCPTSYSLCTAVSYLHVP